VDLGMADEGQRRLRLTKARNLALLYVATLGLFNFKEKRKGEGSICLEVVNLYE